MCSTVCIFIVLFVAVSAHDPCCSFPCHNFGVCTRVGFTDKYICDCYETGYYGENCETPYFRQWLGNLIRPSPETSFWLSTNGKFFWYIVNKVGFLHRFFMKLLIKARAFYPPWPEPHNTAADYITWDGYANKSYYARTLPAVPSDCPTPMGVAGPENLPSVKKLVKAVFERTKFKPSPRGNSLLLPSYGQHFTHQALKSYPHDLSQTWGSHEMDLSHIYGESIYKQRSLRALKGGKMKMQTINGEEFPPSVSECREAMYERSEFCLGHVFFSVLPELVYWSTLWLREHNRLCDVLAEKHPNWDDERLFQTARLNVLAQTMAISTADYAQSISDSYLDLKYIPEVIHDSSMRWGSSRMHVEFNTMYHWHSMVPDYYLIGGKNITLAEILFNMKILTESGMATFTESLSNQIAGRGPGGRNVHHSLLPVIEKTLKMNRQIRLQPYNRYRQYFGLEPIKSFEELTGEKNLARVLRELYDGDVDAIEFMVGILVEQRLDLAEWGKTMFQAIGKYAFRTMFSNPIASPTYWKASTFGGEDMFKMSKTTTLQDLACRNIDGCPRISFRVPEDKIPVDEGIVYPDLEYTKDRDTKDEL